MLQHNCSCLRGLMEVADKNMVVCLEIIEMDHQSHRKIEKVIVTLILMD